MNEPSEAPAQDLFTGLDAPAGEVPDAPEPAAVDTSTPPDDSAPAPAAEASATPTPGAEGTAVPAADPAMAPPDKGNDRTVPLATLIEERKSHREEMAALRAELAEIRKGVAPPAQAQEPQAPETEEDYFRDPKGYTDARTKAVLDRLEALEKTGTDRLSAVEQRTQAEALDRQLAVSQDTFAKATPDFVNALNHVRTVRIQQIRLSNPGVTDDQIRNHILTDERQTAAALLAQGRNPAEYVYQLAKLSGYTPAAQAPAATPSPALSNGAAAGTVPADVTLNRAPGQAPPGPDEGSDGDEVDILEQARTERFRKRA